MATTNFLQLLLLRSRVQISYLSCIFSFKIDRCEAVGVIFSALWHCTAKLLDFSFLLTVEKKMRVTVTSCDWHLVIRYVQPID